MSKGTFSTPRVRSTVSEIHPLSVKIRVDGDGKYTITGNLQEGNDIAGVFETKEIESVRVNERELSAADKIIVDNFLGLLIRLYAADRGYIGVIVS
jgi:hypothetical protein